MLPCLCPNAAALLPDRFTPEAVAREEVKLFLVYQLLHVGKTSLLPRCYHAAIPMRWWPAVAFCHERGVVHGNLTPGWGCHAAIVC